MSGRFRRYCWMLYGYDDEDLKKFVFELLGVTAGYGLEGIDEEEEPGQG